MDLLFPLLIIFMIGMIFFSNRQRKKQQQQQEDLQNSISVGDVVLMTSGISGTVVDTDDERTIDLEIAPDVITTWLRAAVREKLSSDADAVALADEVEDEPALGTAAPATATGSGDARSDQAFADPAADPSGNGVPAGSKESRNN
ncbi:preprotein translocase subunit YajC [Actinomycetospora soli]|uniref:preprotein translocase subunit YajC n=1 Tax=Actinomycetospora soli TaxID=2893887 RepID=UPI001E43333E|nr:preprotein translocase subunit YajC [Actinomycetospora soli]MCD2185705.1 preprotein translocase subunit YajC [Actinomycetospora soli]